MRERHNMPYTGLICLTFLLGISVNAAAQQAVIDIHVHAGNVVQAGPRHPDNLGVMLAYEEEANENNVVLFVASGAQKFVESWSEYFGSRMLAGPVFPCVNGVTANEEATDGRRPCFDTGTEFPDLKWLRQQYEGDHLQVMGELGPQYIGMPVDDPRMSPYYELAAELDVPVLIHVGGGPPLSAERCCPNFRLSVGDPMLIEEVLVRNPSLRVQIQHANVLAYPALFRLLQQFPHVFVDLTPFQTILPREGFHHMLRLYRMHGLVDRIMFGSDEMPVAASLAAYRSANFLSEEELNGILCGNAERFLGLTGTCATKNAVAELADGFDDALSAIGRPAEDRVRDAARKPRQVLEFVGIRAGMTVLDVAAGAGWYTEVLSAAVGDDGYVISHNSFIYGPRNAATVAAKAERLGNITMLFADYGDFRLDAEVDAAFTGLNLHDFQNRSADEGQVFLSGIFMALKPGGVLGLTDHEGSAGPDNASLHRIELATAKAALENAGFVVEAISDVLDNPADDHSLKYDDDSLGRNTDRFVIRARKPE